MVYVNEWFSELTDRSFLNIFNLEDSGFCAFYLGGFSSEGSEARFRAVNIEVSSGDGVNSCSFLNGDLFITLGLG